LPKIGDVRARKIQMEKKIIHNSFAFTIIELMVVVVIVGLMAAFAIPNYQKSVRKAHERDATRVGGMLHEGLQLYYAREGGFLPGIDLDLDTLNSSLGLSLNVNELEVDYDQVNADEYTLSIAWQEAGTYIFDIKVTEKRIDSANPCCIAGYTCQLLSTCS